MFLYVIYKQKQEHIKSDMNQEKSIIIELQGQALRKEATNWIMCVTRKRIVWTQKGVPV